MEELIPECTVPYIGLPAGKAFPSLTLSLLLSSLFLSVLLFFSLFLVLAREIGEHGISRAPAADYGPNLSHHRWK